MSKGPQPARQARSEKTLTALLDAVEALLQQMPVHAISVRKIAHEAECTTGAIYQRFEDKQALIDAAYERFLGRGEQLLEGLGERMEGACLEEAMTLYVDFIVKTFEFTGNLTVAYRRVAEGRPAYLENLAEFGRQASRKLAAVIGANDPHFLTDLGKSQIDFAVRQVLAVCDQKILFGPVEPVIEPLDWEELATELTRSTLAYLESVRD